jgi:hypothetical protein
MRNLCVQTDLMMTTSADRPVIRMFTCENDTVRWETRIADGRGLELKVLGPGALRRDYAFADAMSLVEYQVQYERQLLLNGYNVLPHSDRRGGYDRRRRPRNTEDRRRA